MGYRMLNYIACVLLLQPAVVVAIEQTPSSPRHADVEVASTGSVASFHRDFGLMRKSLLSQSATELSAEGGKGKMLEEFDVRQEEDEGEEEDEEDAQGRSMFEEEEEDEERVAEKITRFRRTGKGDAIDAVFGKLGKNRCPDGYEPVIDEPTCAMAAGVLETDYYKKDCNDCTGAQQWIAEIKFSGGNSSACVGKQCSEEDSDSDSDATPVAHSGKCRGMGMATRHGKGSKFVCVAVEEPEEEEAPRRTGKGEGEETDPVEDQLRADLATTQARLQAVELKLKEAGLELPYDKPEGEGEETTPPQAAPQAAPLAPPPPQAEPKVAAPKVAAPMAAPKTTTAPPAAPVSQTAVPEEEEEEEGEEEEEEEEEDAPPSP